MDLQGVQEGIELLGVVSVVTLELPHLGVG